MGHIVAPHQEASLPGNVSFYSRRRVNVVGQNRYDWPAHRLSLALDEEQLVRPLPAVLVVCASCFSQGEFAPEAAIIERCRRGADRQSNLRSG
jgi:hypothetical protein